MLHDDEGAVRARRLRWMGIDRDTRTRTTQSSYEWEYDVVEVGFKYTMSDIHAVLGRVQLPGLSSANARRAEIAQRYTAGLDDLRALDPPAVPGDRTSSWCLYQVQADCRDELVTWLDTHFVAPASSPDDGRRRRPRRRDGTQGGVRDRGRLTGADAQTEPTRIPRLMKARATARLATASR